MIESISLAGRSVGLCGGGLSYAWVVESPHEVHHSAKFQRPQRSIIPLLTAGTDPTRIFAQLPKKEHRIAISVINKHVQEVVKDLQTSGDQVTIAPGPHPTLISWIILAVPSQELVKQSEGKWFDQEN